MFSNTVYQCDSMTMLRHHDNYPVWIVVITNMHSIIIYALGVYILSRITWHLAIPYVAYVFVLEFRLLKLHCTKCYYLNKRCAFGKGRLSAWLFTSGKQSQFCKDTFTWKKMIPDLLVPAIPFISGIVMLPFNPDTLLIVSLLLLLVLSTTVSGIVRKELTCKFCRQKDAGCPAWALFNK